MQDMFTKESFIRGLAKAQRESESRKVKTKMTDIEKTFKFLELKGIEFTDITNEVKNKLGQRNTKIAKATLKHLNYYTRNIIDMQDGTFINVGYQVHNQSYNKQVATVTGLELDGLSRYGIDFWKELQNYLSNN